MKIDDVPQDNSKTYYGHKRLLYAQNNKGSYTPVQSSGWDVEEAATLDAVNEYNRLAESARQSVIAGLISPLFYHMHKKRMDLPLLAQTTGQFQWQIKRHLKSKIFARLSQMQLLRYADVLDVSINELITIPE